MNRALVIAVTGSVGSGKSEVGRVFESLGARIIDADALAREVVEPNTPGLAEVIAHFGTHLVLANGQLDRKQLAALIFADPKRRHDLEQILHPRIRALFLSRLATLQADQSARNRPIVYIVPLLFESKFSYTELDSIVVVSAPRALCIARIMQRDGCDEALATRKLDAQLPIETKEAQADFVLHNDGTLETLRTRAISVWEQIKRLQVDPRPA